ncbi:hypothetical protein Kpol_1053p29 [Vanderwaltozyma polyspora DSM 70294]|uniref:Ubiquinone biosynthesis O-methyltransferase, mitochondrial n=1 Tax=Vanderwaltozyma polyspora (strain ATCC 22028 / DSM 70294 / BCRC 21397 / CBS 2163 / NBRC 10782 / NRRL Y-8283 / UCD 57-17) TaxID=436907 RepID=A7TN74_VANPO|nr:uncharacterized protein Kpol_1053p29 [Vanderwaltozyma polyspora DSM 70294]EDO16292.1 hypothetical protein Kpol_1053p29 [Vanderwaltozyma polyspora DSM 70294]
MMSRNIVRGTSGSIGSGKFVVKAQTTGVNLRLVKSISTGADKDEVKHFKELAPTWWDIKGSQRILHLMNLNRVDFIRKIMAQSIKISDPDVYVPGFDYKKFLPSIVSRNVENQIEHEINSELLSKQMHILDIGCGGGILTESMARLPYFKQVTGIDLTPEVLEIAKEHVKQDPAIAHKIKYELKPLEEVKQNYEVITCFEMLEHVDKPSEILDHAWKLLKPNGVLFLSTINRDMISWLTTIVLGEYILKVVPIGTHHVEKYINSSEIIEWFKENYNGHFEIMDTLGCMYVPTKGWVEHDRVNVGNYMMAIRKLK